MRRKAQGLNDFSFGRDDTRTPDRVFVETDDGWEAKTREQLNVEHFLDCGFEIEETNNLAGARLRKRYAKNFLRNRKGTTVWENKSAARIVLLAMPLVAWIGFQNRHTQQFPLRNVVWSIR